MTGSQRGSEDAPAPREDTPPVSQLGTAPGRFVFAEDDNSEGWIATDSVVDVER
jgi:hypothetical protein